VVTSDQQHWQAWGGADPFFDTPNMDRLARGSTVFQNAFCTTPQCSPSRASLYTGLYPHRTGVIGNLGSVGHLGQRIGALPARLETLGSRLGAAGYHTGYFGKWHLGNAQHFRTHFDASNLDGDDREGATEQALEFLDEAQQPGTGPFALFVSYINPHDVYGVNEPARRAAWAASSATVPHPASWSETFVGKPAPQRRFMVEDQGRFIRGQPDALWEQYRLFYREKCRLFDLELGRVLDALEQRGLAGNTVVVCTSDHGDMDTHHQLIYKGPFMYEHLVRVPLIIRMPRAAGPRHAAADPLVLLTDVLPTLCELGGADPGETDGTSLVPWLTGQGRGKSREYVVGQYYNKQHWVNPIRMLRTRTFKYTRYIDHGEELYDLKNDPEELVNLARDPDYQRRKKELSGELERWRIEHGDTEFETCWSTNLDGSRCFPDRG
jgi:arylsulfatase A-like enzyme